MIGSLMAHLYNTLFNYDDQLDNMNDITMDIINQLHGHTHLSVISKYFDISAYNDFTFQKNSLNIMHINSRSLPKNFDITTFLNALSNFPDIIGLTEPWLINTNKHLFFNSQVIILIMSPDTPDQMEVFRFILLITFKQNKYMN